MAFCQRSHQPCCSQSTRHALWLCSNGTDMQRCCAPQISLDILQEDSRMSIYCMHCHHDDVLLKQLHQWHAVDSQIGQPIVTLNPAWLEPVYTIAAIKLIASDIGFSELKQYPCLFAGCISRFPTVTKTRQCLLGRLLPGNCCTASVCN